MFLTRKIERCQICGETYGANYVGEKLKSRDLCPCDPKEAEFRKAQAEERVREEERRRRQELAAAEAEAIEREKEREKAQRFQEDAILATECWELSRRTCFRHQGDLFDACHACPRFQS